MRHLGHLGAPGSPRGDLPARRGARLLPLGQHRRGQSVHEPGRAGPEHPADKLHRDPRLQVRLRPGNGPQPQHLRRRNTRNGQDQEPRASAADADERQLPGNRPEGNAHRIHRVDVRGRRLQDPQLRPRQDGDLEPLQPPGIRAHRRGRAGHRGVPHHQHHRRRRAHGRPVLGERGASPLHGAHRVPDPPLPARGQEPPGYAHPAVAG